MRMCGSHWEQLRAAIKARGLWDLVPESGEEAMKRLTATDHSTIDNFDPLMAAHNMIVSNALRVGGLAIMAANEDGSDRCPVCFLNAPNWIQKAADDAAAVASEFAAKPPGHSSQVTGH